MAAELLSYFKQDYADGTVIEAVVWKVPIDKERPHGLKYRLHFGRLDGTCIVRYDNERGKGDHRHAEGKEMPYRFTSLNKLLDDFQGDVRRHRKKMK